MEQPCATATGLPAGAAAPGVLPLLPADSALPALERPSPVVTAAQRLTGQIEALVAEAARLRADNVSLRREIREAVSILERAAATAAAPVRSPRTSVDLVDRRRARRSGSSARRHRATPVEVTGEVVRAVIVKLGESTASEIAAEINRAHAQVSTGTRWQPVSGRAVRFLAERAGAVTAPGERGQRRYRLG